MMAWFRSRRPAAPARRTRLCVDGMEDRSVPASPASVGLAAATVYTESNNPDPGQNAILGFHRNADGSLTQFGTFPTGGTGQPNIPKAVGPDDGDQQVRLTDDGRFLYAVNEGSDSVSAFRVHPNGRLDLIGTFASGGDQPDSIGIAGDHVYVANRGDAASNHPGTTAPGVVGFDIRPTGALTPIAGATAAFPVGTLATQTLVSPDGRFLFVEVGTLAGTPGGNTVNTFRIGADGSLKAAPGGPAGAGTDAPFLLGAAAHPTLNIVYAGFTSAGRVGVFTYDDTGRTSFVGTAADAGAAPCWCAVSGDGRLLYAANTGSNSVGVFSLADPLHPVQIQNLPLGGPQSATGTGRQTAVFELALDPSGRFLYAINQSSDPSFPAGNQLHTLTVAADGTLTEATPPVIFSQADVPADAHPQGLAVFAGTGRGRAGDPGVQVGAGIAAFDFGDDAGQPGRNWVK